MKLIALWGLTMMLAQADVVALPSPSPLVAFRIVFRTGSASDPADKPGLAYLTAQMLAEGGSRELSYKQILDAMYPMATSVSSQVDKEMTVFAANTHADNLEAFYKLFRAMLLDPGWRADDFQRLKDDAMNFLRVELRGNNDEELGKEALYNAIYADHPYGHNNVGTVSSIEKMTLADLQQFYRTHFTQSNLVLGVGGGYSPEFLERMKKDFEKLPKGDPAPLKVPAPKSLEGSRAILIDKDTRSVAYSLGFPIDVKRGDPDFVPLLVAQSSFGQHRNSGGRLYERLREVRGLNYGDYAYIEYFPRGMFKFEPDPNLARQQQIFQIWIRPVEPANAHFALRLALFEFDKLIREGLDEEEFESRRTFLSKYVNLLTKTKQAELGYAIDSRYYQIADYNTYLKNALAKLKREDVNAAIRKHLKRSDLRIVAVTKHAAELKNSLVTEVPSPISYNSAKPQQVLDEDKQVAMWKIGLKPDAVEVIPADKVFE